VRYRVTCLSPTLVGDGQKLAPVDYMVWRDHVNILDQRRIFKLLAKGPRLDSYLSQLKRSEKLDFASWGGFAQNFAGRRIPFEHATMTAVWERATADTLFIPTFAAGYAGPYLPASALKGALRTAAIGARWSHETMERTEARLKTERFWRRLTTQAEADALGSGGADRMRFVRIGDSAPTTYDGMKVHLLRVGMLVSRGNKLELGWKTSGRTADGRRPEEGTPYFAEMAPVGAVFEGEWTENAFLKQPEIAQALHSKTPDRRRLFEAANGFASAALESHGTWADAASLAKVADHVRGLASKVEQAKGEGACVIPLGWGGGFRTKAPYQDTSDEAYRGLLRELPFYSRAIQSGLPFPKTRRLLFANNEPAALPGWVRLDAVE
jgi:CRISPR-associated protein Csm5